MAYNPRDIIPAPQANELTNYSATAIILSPLEVIEASAIEELTYKRNESKALVPIRPAPPPAIIKRLIKREYYMEWWQYGRHEKDIDIGHFHTANLKHFVKLFTSFKKFSLVYLRRCQDDKVLWDRRVRQQ